MRMDIKNININIHCVTEGHERRVCWVDKMDPSSGPLGRKRYRNSFSIGPAPAADASPSVSPPLKVVSCHVSGTGTSLVQVQFTSSQQPPI
jgi:hypothetical protein